MSAEVGSLMRIFFTGGSGKAGNVVAHLAEQDHQVTNADLLPLGHPDVADLHVDLTDLGQTYSAMAGLATMDELDLVTRLVDSSDADTSSSRVTALANGDHARRGSQSPGGHVAVDRLDVGRVDSIGLVPDSDVARASDSLVEPLSADSSTVRQVSHLDQSEPLRGACRAKAGLISPALSSAPV